MSNQQHPITSTDEMVRKWIEDWAGGQMKGPVSDDQRVVATRAAQWGWDQRGAVNEDELQKARDQQLEECCEQLKSIPSPLGIPFGEIASNALHNACRPKPLSEAEQALEIVNRIEGAESPWAMSELGKIRRALERLQKLESLPDD